jgi:hypothetical protein
MFHLMTWPIHMRNLTSVTAEGWAIPALVIKATGQASGAYSQVRMRSTATGYSWTYRVQAGDSESDPIFIHPWVAAGSSSTDGLAVFAYAEDIIVIEGMTVPYSQGRKSTLSILNWSLFEGNAFLETEPAP